MISFATATRASKDAPADDAAEVAAAADAKAFRDTYNIGNFVSVTTFDLKYYFKSNVMTETKWSAKQQGCGLVRP